MVSHTEFFKIRDRYMERFGHIMPPWEAQNSTGEELVARMQQALKSGQPIQVWVEDAKRVYDPDNSPVEDMYLQRKITD